MQLLVVAEADLTRPADALVWVLRASHEVELWNNARFTQNLKEVKKRDGVIFLGDSTFTQALAPTVKVRYRRHGITWGFKGPRALVLGGPVDDPDTAVDAIEREESDLFDEARAATHALGRDPSPEDYRGIHFAGFFLDPNLDVPSSTAPGSGWRVVSTDRALWDGQYKLGIATFLAHGFDAFIAQ